ncbi:alpha/beta-hydrolase [Testicularia cyperi]|uniref:Alpha/beta-hydrolase n=1 Tax=Testicularia cyperi TaxID=1882483 RepID=A0A317XKN2_9BASI|nr:alpha/beta-hydrolase [Testicularia cyperi]
MSTFIDPFQAAGFVPSKCRIPAPSNDPEVDVTIFYQHFKPQSPSQSPKEAGPTPRPILLLHGHPQTHVIWSNLAPSLAKTGNWEVVVPDNRGNGASSAPAPHEDRKQLYSRYSKREMARDMAHVMNRLGHHRFFVVAHDRGARIAHRLALDHPDSVEKLILLDIAPTLDMYNKTEQNFARYYWHWFFLLQPVIPERFILGCPSAYLDALVARFPRTTAAGDTPALNEWRMSHYLANLSHPANVSGIVECYRASSPGGVDLTLDQLDRDADTKIQCPLRVFWGKQGVIHALYDGGLELWQNCAHQTVQGHALDTGHYIPEEAPEQVLVEINSFFT